MDFNNPLHWVLAALAGSFGVYLAARLIFAAWYVTRRQFSQDEKRI